MTNAFIDYDHPANQTLLRLLQSTTRISKKGYDSQDEFDFYETNTHPDLGEILFVIGTRLNPHSWSVAYGYSVLVCPENGLIFAIATGTSTLLFRFSPEQIPHAMSLGAFEAYDLGKNGSFKSSTYGPDWLFVRPWPIPADELYEISYTYTCSLPIAKP